MSKRQTKKQKLDVQASAETPPAGSRNDPTTMTSQLAAAHPEENTKDRTVASTRADAPSGTSSSFDKSFAKAVDLLKEKLTHGERDVLIDFRK